MGAPADTLDPIIRKYRFCNMDRNDDRVTKWIHREWLDPHEDDPHVWFAMVVARLFNQPEMLAQIDYPVPYRPAKVIRTAAYRKAAGDRVFNAAYIVSTNGLAMDKVEYVCDIVLGPLWGDRKAMQPAEGVTLEAWHTQLQGHRGMGSFMAAQVVADVKYAEGSPLAEAEDFYTFAASGPGSRRGLNRVMGHPVKQAWREEAWRSVLADLRAAILPDLTGHMANITAQNLQNVLCEFDKYERARLGEGLPKQLYKPTKETTI